MKTAPIRVPDVGELWRHKTDRYTHWYVARDSYMRKVNMLNVYDATTPESMSHALNNFFNPERTEPLDDIRDGLGGWSLIADSYKDEISEHAVQVMNDAEEALSHTNECLEEFMQ